LDFDTARPNWQLLATPEERRIALAKPEWGLKRTCFSCGARFYDLRREPVVCPVCNAVHDPARQPRPKRSGAAARDEQIPVAAPSRAGRDEEVQDDQVMEGDADELEEAADGGEESDIDDLGSEEGEIIEDASELGEDDDDIGEVMEHMDDEMEDKA
jgi:uncharacterized protein (TIGR02300 family)